jgi:glycerol-3-phosphate acyltransferase PlsY
MNFIIFGIIAYLLGSIPTAVWIGKSKYGIDIRKYGSKNAGATNTFRVLGKNAGIVVLSIDILKGFMASFLPVIFINKNLQSNEIVDVQILSSFMAIIGHMFPVFEKFKGGKGVATSLGVIFGISPISAGIGLIIFLIIFLIFKFVSLAAIITALFFPFIVYFTSDVNSIYLVVFSVILSTVVIIAHRKNIKRLINGTENKMIITRKNK